MNISILSPKFCALCVLNSLSPSVTRLLLCAGKYFKLKLVLVSERFSFKDRDIWDLCGALVPWTLINYEGKSMRVKIATKNNMKAAVSLICFTHFSRTNLWNQINGYALTFILSMLLTSHPLLANQLFSWSVCSPGFASLCSVGFLSKSVACDIDHVV